MVLIDDELWMGCVASIVLLVLIIAVLLMWVTWHAPIHP